MAASWSHHDIDPGLASLRRGLWQLTVLGGIAALLAIAAGAPSLGIGPAAWLLALPLAALAAAYRDRLASAARELVARRARRRPAMTFVLQGLHEARASVRLPSTGARDATDRNLLPGRRAARLQRRSPRHDHRPEPLAGRR